MHFTGTTVLRVQDGKISEEIGLDGLLAFDPVAVGKNSRRWPAEPPALLLFIDRKNSR
jgi:hypothetical protein